MDPRRPIDPEDLAAHAAAVHGLARAIVRDAHEAEDVAQDTIALAMDRELGPRGGWDLRAWLAGVTRNVARGRVRAGRRRLRRERCVARAEATSSTFDVVARLSEQRAVVSAVLALPEPYRTVVTLRWFEGLPPRAVAARLGIPVETVRTRAKRALPMLRELLTRRHGDDRRKAMAALLPLALPRPWVLPWIGGAIVATKTQVVAGGAVAVALVLAAVAWAPGDTTRTSEGPPVAHAEVPGAPVAELRGRDEPVAPPPAAAPVAARDVGILLRGRVLASGGTPLAGATVEAQDPDAFGAAGGAGEVTTTADGAFRLEVPLRLRHAVRLVARAPGHRAATVLARPDPTMEAVLRLDPAPRLRFRVLDAESDQPVAGAVATMIALRTGGEWTEGATSDAEGIVVVSDPGPPAHPVFTQPVLQVTHPGHEPARVSLWEGDRRRGGAGEHTTDVYLRPGRAAVVRVVAEDGGTPVAGVRVRGWSGGAGPVGVGTGYVVPANAFALFGDALTDEEGMATLGAPMTDAQAIVVAEGPGVVAVRCLAEGGARATSPWRMVLQRVVRVSGRAVDERDRPVAGAHVEAEWRQLLADKKRREPGDAFPQSFPPAAWFDRVAATTGSDGKFTLDWVAFPLGWARFSAFATGREGWAEKIAEPETGEGLPDLLVRLVRSANAWRVRVRDAAGRGIAGALVGRPQTHPMTRTDAQGFAQLVPVAAPGEPAVVFAAAPGFATKRVEVDLESREKDLDIVLEPARSLAVRTVDATGRPCACSVQVLDTSVPDAESLPISMPLDLRLLGSATTDADGLARFDDLPQGPVVVWAGVTTRRDASARVAVGDADRVEVRLPASLPDPAAGSLVEGAVVTVAGEPVLRYRASMEAAGTVLTATLEGRRFTFESVPPGTYDLIVQPPHPGRRVIREVVVPEGGGAVRGIVIRLGEQASVAGRLDLSGGAPRTTRRVMAMAVGTRRAWGTSVDAVNDEPFLLEGLDPGRYALRLTDSSVSAGGPSFQLRDGMVDLAAGQRLERTFDLVPAVRLWLRGDDVRLAENAAAMMADPSSFSRWVVIELTDADGARQSGGGLYRTRTATPFLLTPGRYRLTITHNTAGRFERDLTVTGTSDLDLEVRFEPR